jgi:DNA-binding transcriptional ArsR family regulator
MPQRARSSPTDHVFAALSNPTRRDVLDLLLAGPLPVQDIAARFDMARPSVSEHLRVLRDAGLVTETRSGRQRMYAVAAEPLAHLQDWLSPYERFWRASLAGLAGFLDRDAQDVPADPAYPPVPADPDHQETP